MVPVGVAVESPVALALAPVTLLGPKLEGISTGIELRRVPPVAEAATGGTTMLLLFPEPAATAFASKLDAMEAVAVGAAVFDPAVMMEFAGAPAEADVVELVALGRVASSCLRC